MIRPVQALDPARSISQALLRIFQTQQGLPDAAIYAVHQMHDGYLILGTQTGLVRFDGVRFAPVESTSGDSITKIWVRDLLETTDGTLWIATDGGGFFSLRDGVAKQYSTAEGLASHTVSRLLLARGGTLWACTDKGLSCLVDGRISNYGPSDGVTVQSPRVVCQTLDGTVYFGGDGLDLLSYRDGKFVTRQLKSLPAHVIIRAMLADPDGSLWLGTNSGLLHLQDNTETLLTIADGLADNSVYALQPMVDGGMWIGTKDGFTRFRGKDRESFRARDGLSQSTVYCMCEDQDGSLWVGTKHGLNQFLNRRVTPWTTSEGLSSNDTGPLLQDHAGQVWVGTIGAGLNRFDGAQFKKITVADGLASNIIYSLAEDAGHDLWVGTDRGVTRMHDGQPVRTFAVADGLPSNIVRCMLVDQQGQLLVATAGGLARFADDRFTPVAGLGSAALVAIEKWGKDELIAAVEGGGLYRWKAGVLTDLPQPNAPYRPITSLQTDSDNTLWIGTTDGGLRMLRDDKLVSYSMRDGLFDSDIFAIVNDGAGHMWMGCSKGIFWVARSDLMQFAAGETKHFVSSPFSPTEAMRTIECKPGVQPAYCRMTDGHIWFSTTHGIIVIDPSRLQRAQQPPPVVIERVAVNGKPERPEHIGALPPGSNNLEFSYTGLSFLAPNRIAFQYKLEGFDRDWTEANSRRDAFYTNLPPGKYRFRVTARNGDTHTEYAESAIAFSLAPHYYQRTWFLPLCGTLALVSAWLAYRMRVFKIKFRMVTILAERSRIARELHDTLIQGFSGVTMEMQALAGQLPPTRERSTLHEIIRDAGLCLREARQSVAGLRSGSSLSSGTAAGLPAALMQSARQMTETKDVRLRLNIQPQTPALDEEVEYHILRIAQEAMANALKHASPGQLDVSLEPTRDRIVLTITDDGLGFDSKLGPASGHYGLIGIRERAAQVGASVKILSAPGRGTTVKLQIPFGKKVATPNLVSRPVPEALEEKL